MITALIIFIITYIFIGLRQSRSIRTVLPAGALAGVMLLVLMSGDTAAAERVQAGKVTREQVITVTPADPDLKPMQFRVVLLCDSDALRARGLSGFRPLKRDEAALFTYERPEPAVFWMASVTFPIDIFFVDEQGTVVRVYSNCLPGSKDLYPSGRPVKWVIETAAGSGIREGDRVIVGSGR